MDQAENYEGGNDVPKDELLKSVQNFAAEVERSSIRVHELRAILRQVDQQTAHHTETGRERQMERESFRVSLESGKARTGNLTKERERLDAYSLLGESGESIFVNQAPPGLTTAALRHSYETGGHLKQVTPAEIFYQHKVRVVSIGDPVKKVSTDVENVGSFEAFGGSVVFKRKQEALALIDEAEKNGVEIQSSQRNARRSRMLELLRFTQCGNDITRNYVRELDGKLAKLSAGNKNLAENLQQAQEKIKTITAAEHNTSVPFPDTPEVDRNTGSSLMAAEKEFLQAAGERFQKARKVLEDLSCESAPSEDHQA